MEPTSPVTPSVLGDPLPKSRRPATGAPLIGGDSSNFHASPAAGLPRRVNPG